LDTGLAFRPEIRERRNGLRSNKETDRGTKRWDDPTNAKDARRAHQSTVFGGHASLCPPYDVSI
jgi:hypothetical protein